MRETNEVRIECRTPGDRVLSFSIEGVSEFEKRFVCEAFIDAAKKHGLPPPEISILRSVYESYTGAA